MYQKPNAPLSIGGVLDDGFRLLRASFSRVIGLSLLGSLLGLIPNLLIPNPEAAEVSATTGLALVVLLLVYLPLSVIIFVAIVSRVDAVADNAELSVKGSLRVGLGRFFPVIGCFLLYGLAIVGGSLALVIPGIILGLTLSFGPYLVVTDKSGPLESLKVSHRLVWGNWWRTAAIFTVILFIAFAFYALLGAMGGVAIGFGGSDSGNVTMVSNVVTALGGAVISPLMYAFVIAVLNDLKLRKQGDDLEDRIGALEAE